MWRIDADVSSWCACCLIVAHTLATRSRFTGASPLRLALRALLESLSGITILGEAADGAEAVRLAKNHQPDAMLLDLAMPVMDGLEALPFIGAASPGTKVIIMSGYGKDHVAQQALQRGATAFFEKADPAKYSPPCSPNCSPP